MKINNRKELHNIAINLSADINYNDFMRIYRECTREPYCFFTIDTTLSAGDPRRFRKNLIPSYKNHSSWSNQNFGRKEEQKEEWPLKIMKNIEGKNEEN